MSLNRPRTAASARETAIVAPSVFLAASHNDRRFAERLANDLRALYGDERAVICDTRGSKVGSDPLWNEVRSGIVNAPMFIAVLSPEALASKWVNDEIDQAFQLLGTRPERKIVPIIWRQCTMRPDISVTQVVRFAPPRAYNDGFADLTRALGMPSMALSEPKVTRRTFLIGAGLTLGVAAAAAEAIHAGILTTHGTPTITASMTWPVAALPGTTLALGDGTLYASAVNRGQAATSMSPGAYVYALDTAGNAQPITVETNLLNYHLSSPVTDGSRIYVLTNSDYGDVVQALDATSHGQAWNYPLTTDGSHYAPPALANGQLIAVAQSPAVVLINPSGAGGSLVWSATGISGAAVAGPVIVDTLAYASFATKSDGNVYALTLASGGVAQTYPLHAPPTTAPTVTSSALYVAAGKSIFAFAVGKPSAPLWTFTAQATVTTALVASSTTVYFADSAGTVYALDATTGRQQWTASRQASANAAPLLSPSGNRLYVASDLPAVYALAPATGSITATYTLSGKPVTSPLLSTDGKTLSIGAADTVSAFTTV